MTYLQIVLGLPYRLWEKIMAKTSEGKVKDKIKKILVDSNVWFYMPVNMGMGVSGIPDFICCIQGKFFSIEAKAGSGKTTGLQEMQMARIRAAGGTTLIINEDKLEQLALWVIKNNPLPISEYNVGVGSQGIGE